MGFTLQGFGPFLHWMTLGVLALAPILIGVVLYKLGGLPGAVARSRQHPQAEAINVCGWMGLITIVLWPIAMIWAHLAPSRPITGAIPDVVGDRASLLAKLQKASSKLSDIEARLEKRANERV